MGPPDGGEDIDVEDLVDAADRFERSIDVQIQTLNAVNDKAEHVTRLLGLLIGAILSVVAVGVRVNDGSLSPPNTPLLLLFIAGLASLLLAMTLSTITYLSSKFKIGLHYRPAQLLSQDAYSVGKQTHYKRIIGTYAYNLERNEEVIDVNAKRFRRALVALLVGVVFLSAAGISFLASLGPDQRWLVVAIAIVVNLSISAYILTGRYLTLEGQL